MIQSEDASKPTKTDIRRMGRVRGFEKDRVPSEMLDIFTAAYEQPPTKESWPIGAAAKRLRETLARGGTILTCWEMGPTQKILGLATSFVLEPPDFEGVFGSAAPGVEFARIYGGDTPQRVLYVQDVAVPPSLQRRRIGRQLLDATLRDKQDATHLLVRTVGDGDPFHATCVRDLGLLPLAEIPYREQTRRLLCGPLA